MQNNHFYHLRQIQSFLTPQSWRIPRLHGRYLAKIYNEHLLPVGRSIELDSPLEAIISGVQRI